MVSTAGAGRFVRDHKEGIAGVAIGALIGAVIMSRRAASQSQHEVLKLVTSG